MNASRLFSKSLFEDFSALVGPPAPSSSLTPNKRAEVAAKSKEKQGPSSKDETKFDFDDPDILNNIEKLMKVEFDEPLLQVAKSPTFADYIDAQSEIVLQNEDFLSTLEFYRKNKISDKVVANVTRDLDAFDKFVDHNLEKCFQFYSSCMNKPFWIPKWKEEALSEEKAQLVQSWLETGQKFLKAYERITKIRNTRRSIYHSSTSSEEDDEAQGLVATLKEVMSELERCSKVLDVMFRNGENENLG